MDKKDLQAAVLEQVAQAEGFDSDELSELREKALDYYFNRDSAAPSIPGRSKQQSTDVADMVENDARLVAHAMEAGDFA